MRYKSRVPPVFPVGLGCCCLPAPAFTESSKIMWNTAPCSCPGLLPFIPVLMQLSKTGQHFILHPVVSLMCRSKWIHYIWETLVVLKMCCAPYSILCSWVWGRRVSYQMRSIMFQCSLSHLLGRMWLAAPGLPACNGTWGYFVWHDSRDSNAEESIC